MDKFNLTNKKEVLDYLSNQNIVLSRQEYVATIKGALSQMGGAVSYMVWSTIADGDATSTLIEHPIASGICLGGLAISIIISSNNFGKYHLCHNQIAENDKRMKWIENGTFQKNSLRELEEEVIEARQSNFSKTRINLGKF